MSRNPLECIFSGRLLKSSFAVSYTIDVQQYEWDILISEIVEPSGILKEQIFEDIHLARLNDILSTFHYLYE